MMAAREEGKKEQQRVVITALAEVELQRLPAAGLYTSSPPPFIRSLALWTTAAAETLIYAGSHSGNLFCFSFNNPSSSSSSSSLLSNSNSENSNSENSNSSTNNNQSSSSTSTTTAATAIHSNSNSNNNKNGRRLDSSNNLSLLKSIKLGDSAIDSLLLIPEIGRILLLLADGSLHFTDKYLSSFPLHNLGVGVGSGLGLRFLKGAGVTAVAKKLTYSQDMPLSTRLDLLNLDFHSPPTTNPRRRTTSSNSSSSSSSSRGGGGGGASGKIIMNARSRAIDFLNYPKFAALANRKLFLCAIKVASGTTDGEMMDAIVTKAYDYGDLSVLVYREFQHNLDEVMDMLWIDNSLIIASRSGYSLFSCNSGHISPVFSLPDHSSSPPLLTAFPRQKEVLLLADDVGIFSNSSGQPVGGSLVFKQVPQSIAHTAMHVVAVKDGNLDVYHRRTGALVQSLPGKGEKLGRTMVVNDESGSGEFLVAAMPDKLVFYRQVTPEEQIKDLLRKENFAEAISFVEELEVDGGATKEMLSFVHAQVGFLLLFDLHFEEAVNHFLKSETMQPSEIFPFIMRDPNRWTLLVPRNRYWGLHPPPVLLEEVIDNGLMAIQRGMLLRKAGVDTGTNEIFVLNLPSRSELLEQATQNIVRYLTLSRNEDLSHPVKEGIDTLLMYLYRALDSTEEMEKLAWSPNYCVVEELENLLEDSGHLRPLAFLYSSKGIYSKSLDIWRILARDSASFPWKSTSSRRTSQHHSTETTQKDAAVEASHILEELPDKAIILQHLEWIVDIDDELAVAVLTSEKRGVLIPPDEVLAALDSKNVGVVQRYLRWLIEDKDFEDSEFHTKYALSLAESAIDAAGSENSDHLPSATMSKDSFRERLQLFLDSSDLYDAKAVLDSIGGSDMWLEKAILYRKLGEESLVLKILALKLENYEAAEQYCAEIGRTDAYMKLLDMYLDPQDGKEPMFKAAVRLLHNHGESLDPRQVLETLSPDMPLQLASDTLLRMLRARTHHHRQGEIVYHLSRAINLDSKLSRFEERSRHVQINGESLCDSCHTRLGTKLLAMYPDDSVVCYKCFRRQSEYISPVNGRNFRRDIIFKPGWLVKGP